MENIRYYIAYGSNLNMGQMAYRCPNAVPVGTAVIHDWKLMFRGSGSGNYFTIDPAKGCEVPVVVWAVNEQDIRNLDRYEGYPYFYYKQDFRLTVTTFGGDKKRMRTFVYIMTDIKRNDKVYHRPAGRPSQQYFDTCFEGYKRFKFDPQIMYDALNDSIAEQKALQKKITKNVRMPQWENWVNDTIWKKKAN